MKGFVRSSLQMRLFLSFVIVIGVPLVVVSTLTNILYTRHVYQLVVDQKRELVQASLVEIAQLRREEEQVSDQILMNPTIQSALRQPLPQSGESLLLQERAITTLIIALQAPTTSTGVLVIDRSGHTYRSSTGFGSLGGLPLLGELASEPVFTESKGRNIWIARESNIISAALESRDLNGSYLYLLRKINDLKVTRKWIGTVVIQIPYQIMADALDRTSRGAGEYSILADASGMILARSGGSSGIWKRLASPLFEQQQGVLASMHFSSMRSGRAGITQIYRLPDTDWTVIQHTPRATILSRSRQVQAITVGVFLLFLLASFGVSYSLSRGITRPIARLSAMLRDFGMGRIDARIPSDRADEIGQLEASFNTMGEDIKGLLARIDEEHVQRRKLELNMLEYQVNPHFLYNILDSINWMAQKAGQLEIGALVTALARFFRIGLSSGRDFITVGEELEHARNYLIICQMRYKDCFDFAVSSDEELLKCQTLKILLQPVVENAIKHGFDKNRDGGSVVVECRSDGGDIVFGVRDNGRGMGEDRLRAIQERLDSGEEAEELADGGIGLANLHQRVRLNYGERYGLTIASTLGIGTTVSIRIPRRP